MNYQLLASNATSGNTGTTTSDFFGRISIALKSIYTGISGIFTLVAAVAVAICSVGMLASKNQKTVEEFKSWRTRVIVTWLIFNMLGIFVSFGQELTSDMGYTV